MQHTSKNTRPSLFLYSEKQNNGQKKLGQKSSEIRNFAWHQVRNSFKFENATPLQTPANIEPIDIYPCFYLRNHHAVSATTEIEKWLRSRSGFSQNWLRVQEKNAESCWSRLWCQAKFLTYCCLSVILLLRITKSLAFALLMCGVEFKCFWLGVRYPQQGIVRKYVYYRKILNLILDPNYFYFSNINQKPKLTHLPKQ